jgi:hypothetical protein
MNFGDCNANQDLYCNRLTLKCAKNPPDAKEGELCGTLRDGSSANVSCIGGLTCSAPALDGFARACERRSQAGGPCNLTEFGPACIQGALCLNKMCVYLQPAECR